MVDSLARCETSSETGCSAVRLSTFIFIVLLASKSMAADVGNDLNTTVNRWAQSASPVQPTLGLPELGPQVDLVSFPPAKHGQPAGPIPMLVDYDNGLQFANHATDCASSVAFPFRLRLNSWIQVRHTLFDSDGPNEDQNTFSIERLRFEVGGHVASPDFQYFFQFDGNSNKSTEAFFLDYYGSYDLGRALLGCQANKFGVRVGKWKVPFSRSRQETARLLQFTDRSTANVFFDIDRSIGVGIYGQLDSFAAPIKFETAVFDGFRTGELSTIREVDLDRNFGWSLRTSTNLFSDIRVGEADLSWHRRVALQLGSGLAYTRVDDEGPSEFTRQRVVDSGATLASLLPAGVSAYDVWFYTVDSHWKYHGCSLIAEYYWRHMARFDGGSVPNLFDHGFNLQTGYFVCPKKLELIFRWSRIVGDSGTLGMLDQSSDEVAGGVAWYMNGQNAKLVFDATHLNGAPVDDAIDLLAGDAGWVFRTQLQFGF
jgi:hypothetical protein